MKKVISMLVLVVMVLALGVSAAGCKSTTNAGTGNTGSFVDAIPGGTADVSADVLEALTKETSISTYTFGSAVTGDSEKAKWYQGLVQYFDEVYNGKVEYIELEWGNWEKNHLTKYAANDCADLIYLFEKNFPKFASRGMVYSVEEMQEKGVVAFDHPVIQKDYDHVSTYYKYNGQQYTFAKNTAEADMIFVNEDLFDKYNVKSPTDYYNEGIWNWETFEKCAKELTRDTDGDDKNDVFGYYGWDGNFIINAAGGELIHLNDDGTLEVTLDSAATLQGLENYANVYGRLKVTSKTGFGSGNLGMIAWMPSNEVKYFVEGEDQYTFNWGMVPFPLDERTNTTGIRSGKSYAWCVSTTCPDENIQGCINFIIAKKTYESEYPEPGKVNYADVFTTEQLEMINDCTRQAVVPIYSGVGTLYDTQWDFWGQVGRGVAATEIVASYKSMFEAQVQLENNYAG